MAATKLSIYQNYRNFIFNNWNLNVKWKWLNNYFKNIAQYVKMQKSNGLIKFPQNEKSLNRKLSTYICRNMVVYYFEVFQFFNLFSIGKLLRRQVHT